MDTIEQILQAAEDNCESILKHKDNKYLRNFMQAAYLPEFKMNLPDTDPPYKENPQHPEQLRGTFWQIVKKIDIFQRKDLKPLRQETLFIQALESIPANEAKILLAAKDQTLHKIYKGVTLAKLKKVGYFA
jgi:vacuolar-type H+-ATPase subunit E/Vma4